MAASMGEMFPVLDPAVQTTGAAVMDHSKGKDGMLEYYFLSPVFPCTAAARCARLDRPEEQPEDAIKLL